MNSMKDYFEQTVEKTMRLIAIDSVQSDPCPASPFGEGVAKCLDFVCETAKEMGMSVNNEKGYYCTCDIGEGETFGILGHIDVVPYDLRKRYSRRQRTYDVLSSRGGSTA